MSLAPEAVPPLQRAVGVGRLSVRQLDGRTRLNRLYQEGCAKIRIPKTYHGTALEAVVINTSGGVTGGDRMNWRFDAGPGTHLMLTTQACEKVYKSSGGVAENTIALSVEAGARLAWLPQETILFERAGLSRSITADLAADAEALFLEPIVLGRRSIMQICTTDGAFLETAGCFMRKISASAARSGRCCRKAQSPRAALPLPHCCLSHSALRASSMRRAN